MENKPRVVFDTNVLISAIVFGGKPRQLLQLSRLKQIQGIISPILIVELVETLIKKFSFDTFHADFYRKSISKIFEEVQPRKEIHVLRDKDDDSVLEVAVESNADFIVTGDKDLLVLKKYKKIQILTPSDFLEFYEREMT